MFVKLMDAPWAVPTADMTAPAIRSVCDAYIVKSPKDQCEGFSRMQLDQQMDRLRRSGRDDRGDVVGYPQGLCLQTVRGRRGVR